MSTHPRWESRTDQRIDTVTDQLDEPRLLLGLLAGMCEWLLTGAEMAQRQAPPWLTPAWVAARKDGDLDHTAYHVGSSMSC